MRYFLCDSAGLSIGLWHKKESLGQTIDTNHGRMQVVDIKYGNGDTSNCCYIFCEEFQTPF